MPNQHAVDTYPTFPVNHRNFLSLLNGKSLELHVFRGSAACDEKTDEVEKGAM